MRRSFQKGTFIEPREGRGWGWWGKSGWKWSPTVLFSVFLLPYSAENLSIERKKIQNESIDTLVYIALIINMGDGWMEEKEREQKARATNYISSIGIANKTKEAKQTDDKNERRKRRRNRKRK